MQMNKKNKKTYSIGNPDPVLGQAQKCVGLSCIYIREVKSLFSKVENTFTLLFSKNIHDENPECQNIDIMMIHLRES